MALDKSFEPEPCQKLRHNLILIQGNENRYNIYRRINEFHLRNFINGVIVFILLAEIALNPGLT